MCEETHGGLALRVHLARDTTLDKHYYCRCGKQFRTINKVTTNNGIYYFVRYEDYRFYLDTR